MPSPTDPLAHPPHQSLMARILSRLAPIEPHETPAVVAAFGLFFFFWAGYFAVRPVRETVGTILGRDQVADLWVVTWIASLAIVPIYGAIVARVRRSIFLPLIYGFVALVLLWIGFEFRGDQIDAFVGKFFYVFISVLNLFLISVFWSFLLELFDTAQTKRLFGIIAAGGTAGALAGPLVADLSVNSIGNSGILYLSAGLFVAAILCQRVLLGIWDRRDQKVITQIDNDRPIGGNLFAGVTLLLRSPYLLGIALFVVFVSVVNTFLYFEQLRLVEEAFPDRTERTRIFARLDWIVQLLTILSQIFLTGRIAKKFGVVALLLIVPVTMIFGFLGLAVSGTFIVLAFTFVARRALEYAFARPGREMLWSPLDKETKYKVKNTVDVPVYRGADALAAQVSNGLSSGGMPPAGVALLGAGIAAVWAGVAWWLGKRCESLTNAEPATAASENAALTAKRT